MSQHRSTPRSQVRSLSTWAQQRRSAFVRAVAVLLAMLGLAVGAGEAGGLGSALAIVVLGAALAWFTGVRLLALELSLLETARHHRLPTGGIRQRLIVLAVFAYACEAAAAAGITGWMAFGTVHPLAVVLTLEFGTLALLWNQLMVAGQSRRLAGELAPKLQVAEQLA